MPVRSEDVVTRSRSPRSLKEKKAVSQELLLDGWSRRVLEDSIVALMALLVFMAAPSLKITIIGILLISFSLYLSWGDGSEPPSLDLKISQHARRGVDLGLTVGLLALPVLTAAQSIHGRHVSDGIGLFVQASECSLVLGLIH